jgi:hypothetical protein
MTTATPLDRLASLSTERTTRTDRLRDTVCALLSKLDDHAEVGTHVEVDGYRLCRGGSRTNIGFSSEWYLEHENRFVALERAVDGQGYIHGDFNHPWSGPSRADLVAFAVRAGQFVEALFEREERALVALAAAQSGVEGALEKLGAAS